VTNTSCQKKLWGNKMICAAPACWLLLQRNWEIEDALDKLQKEGLIDG
jgi:hypothetical protein